jgi:2-iminobutanoate/2-iminopropanoate deaminase
MPSPSWDRITAPGLPELPAFAHAAVAGDDIYVAGMLGLTDDFSALVPGGIAAETTQALRHVDRILRACDARLADVVKVSVYMTDLSEWEAMNRAYVQVFGPLTPARIAVGVAGLLFGAAVEFDCIALRKR